MSPAGAIKKLTPAKLQTAVGAEVAAILMRTFGGRTIPRLSPFHMKLAKRHDEIRAFARAHGYSAAATKFRRSERQIRRIVHGR